MEGAFRAFECRLAQMNVFSHYCLTFSANDCVFPLNEQQKVEYNRQDHGFNPLIRILSVAGNGFLSCFQTATLWYDKAFLKNESEKKKPIELKAT